MIPSPRGLLRKPNKAKSGDVVMVAYLAPAHGEEKASHVVFVNLSVVAEAMGFLVVDPMQRAPALKVRKEAAASAFRVPQCDRR